MTSNLPQTSPVNKGPSALAKEIMMLFSDTFGVVLEDLNLDTDLIEDFDLKSDLEGLARFVHSVNNKYEVDLKLSVIVSELDQQHISTLGDLVTMVEEAQLE